MTHLLHLENTFYIFCKELKFSPFLLHIVICQFSFPISFLLQVGRNYIGFRGNIITLILGLIDGQVRSSSSFILVYMHIHPAFISCSVSYDFWFWFHIMVFLQRFFILSFGFVSLLCYISFRFVISFMKKLFWLKGNVAKQKRAL